MGVGIDAGQSARAGSGKPANTHQAALSRGGKSRGERGEEKERERERSPGW